MKPQLQALAGCAIIALSATSCNLFSPFDNPTSDPQLISAARACLDNGDYECAKEHYQQLSASSADIANSEMAFTILNENGAGMAQFAAAFGSGEKDGAAALTQFAESMVAGAGETKRTNIWSAYEKVALIQAPTLKNFVQFVTTLALSAELLAEAAGNDGILSKTDLTSGGTTCDSSAPACLADVNCGHPTGNALEDASGAYDIDTTEPTGATTNVAQLYSAITKAVDGLNALDSGGKFAQVTESLTALKAVGSPTNAATSQCFRGNLVSEGLGQ